MLRLVPFRAPPTFQAHHGEIRKGGREKERERGCTYQFFMLASSTSAMRCRVVSYTSSLACTRTLCAIAPRDSSRLKHTGKRNGHKHGQSEQRCQSATTYTDTYAHIHGQGERAELVSHCSILAAQYDRTTRGYRNIQTENTIPQATSQCIIPRELYGAVGQPRPQP